MLGGSASDALESSSILWGSSTPDAVGFASVERMLKSLRLDRALRADRFGVLDTLIVFFWRKEE